MTYLIIYSLAFVLVIAAAVYAPLQKLTVVGSVGVVVFWALVIQALAQVMSLLTAVCVVALVLLVILTLSSIRER